MKRLRGSNLGRSVNCIGSLVLPQTDAYNDRAAHGTELHLKLREFGHADHPWRGNIPDEAQAEVALAYDVATGIGRFDANIDSLGPFEISGTADVYHYDEFDDTVTIIDWKTGRIDQERASDNAQLKFYALAAGSALARMPTYFRTVVVYLDKLKDDETTELADLRVRKVDSYVHERGEIEAFAGALKALPVRHAEQLKAYKKHGPQGIDVTSGPWCEYCPARDRCPARTALVSQAHEMVQGTPILDLAAAQNDDLARVLDFVRSIGGVAEKTEKLVKEEILRRHETNGNVALEDGSRLAVIRSMRHYKALPARDVEVTTIRRAK